MFLELFLLKFLSIFLYSLMAIIIWDVVTRRLLMEKVFSLILVFFLLSFWMLLNNLEFLPLVILLLYVGAIAVLFLFVVMILNPDFIDLLHQKQQLVTQLKQRQFALKALLSNYMPQNLSKTGKTALEVSNDLFKLLDKEYPNIDKQLKQQLNKQLEKTKEVTQDVVNVESSFYYSYFFMGLLLGSILGGVFYWFSYLNTKFFVATIWVQKALQIFSISMMEQELASQLGNLSLYATNFFAEIKVQAYYYPL